MNTKTIKMLSVFAVLAVALASFAILAPSEEVSAEVTADPITDGTATVCPTAPTEAGTSNYYYVSEDMDIKVPVAASTADGALYLLVEPGVTVGLTGMSSNVFVKIYAVKTAVLESTDTYKVTTYNNYGQMELAENEEVSGYVTTQAVSSTVTGTKVLWSMESGELSVITENINVSGNMGETIIKISNEGSINANGVTATVKVYTDSDWSNCTATYTLTGFSGKIAGYTVQASHTAGASIAKATAGTIELTSGTSSIRGEISSAAKIVQGITTADNVKTINAITVSGPVRNYGTLQLYELPAIVTDHVDWSIYNDGQIILKALDGVVAQLYGKTDIIAGPNGYINMDDFQAGKELYVRGNFSNYDLDADSITIVEGDTVLESGKTLNVFGKLVISAGATLTIKEGAQIVVGKSTVNSSEAYNTVAQLINYGNIEFMKTSTTAATVDAIMVYSGNLINYGSFYTPGDYSTSNFILASINAGDHGHGYVLNDGTMVISQGDRVTFSIINSEDASLTVSGSIVEKNAITNYGNVLFDGATVEQLNTATVDVYNLGSGMATVSSINMVAAPSWIAFWAGKDLTSVSGCVILATNGPNELSGVIFSSEAKKVGTKTYYMVGMTGTPSISGDENAILNIAVGADSYALVSNVFTIDSTINFGMMDGSKLYVDGTLTTEANYVALTGEADIYVDGLIKSKKVINVEGVTINAAYYTVAADATYYSPLEIAVPAAVGASVTNVYVNGSISMLEDTTIPAGLNVQIRAESTLTVGSSKLTPVLTIEVGGKLSGAGTVTVLGTVFAEKENNVSVSTITADVITVNKLVGSKMWTNLNDAMSYASEGSIVCLSKAVTISKDTTVPEGITLDAAGFAITVKDAELTVDGILVAAVLTFTDGDYDGETGTTEINGKVVRTTPLTDIIDKAGDVVGYTEEAIYAASDVTATTYNVLTGIDNLPAVAAQGIDATIYATKIGTMTVIGTGENTLTFNGKVEDADLTIADVKLVIPKNVDVTISIDNGVGEFVFVDANSSAKGMTFTEADDVLTLTGSTTKKAASETFSAKMDGAAAVSGYTIDQDVTIDGVIAAEGTVKMTANVTINGSLIADNGAKVTLGAAAKDVTVLGTLSALEATADESAGRITIDSPTLVIGNADEIIGADAAVTGKVTAAQYWVYNDSTIDDSIIADLKSMTFEVADDDWLVIYGSGNIEIVKSGTTTEDIKYNIVPAMTSAQFKYWIDEEGNPVLANKAIANQTYVALINTHVYDVVIKTDAGVKSVALNGMIMVSGVEGENVFVLEDLPADSYKVTYTLKAGYEGTPTLSTVDGTVLKDYTIIVLGDYSDDIVYQLSGTQKEVEPEPVVPEKESEWTITTILLVILVILIAIMAVIVALRLNRS